jgi:hypothetical protein
MVSVAVAAEPGDAGPPGPGGMHHGMMHHHMLHALKHLRAQLKLTDQQGQLWDAALQKMHPSPDARKDMAAHHHEMIDALKSPDFDPHHMADAMDKMHAEHEAHMKEVRDAWLAVWDSLDADQRTKVRHFLLHMHHAGHGGHHGAPKDAGDAAAAPAPKSQLAAPAPAPAPAPAGK